MLDALALNVVDFLITEDVRIHKRAERAGLRPCVFTVREALAWIQRTFEPKEFQLPFVLPERLIRFQLMMTCSTVCAPITTGLMTGSHDVVMSIAIAGLLR
jgi:hypothetical protein